MKTLLITLSIVLLAAVSANAQTWHTANQVTLAWSAVAPIQPTDTIKYQVFTKFRETAATPQAVGDEITATSMPVSFTVEGKYYICAQTVRYVQGETDPVKSDLSCSDQADVTYSGIAFGVKYFVNPNKPGGLRIE